MITALSLLGSGATADAAALLVLRAVSGICGALVFIAGAVLSARLAARVPRDAEGFTLTSYYAGPGLGIALSGPSLPYLLATGLSWREGWWGLGTMAFLLAIPCAWSVGRASSGPAGGRPAERTHGVFTPALAPLGVAYFLFAVGYFA